MDINHQIARLHQRLVMDGYPVNEADAICSEVAADISQAIAMAVADAIQSAEEAGADSEKFLSQLTVMQTGPTFIVTTDSGRTDFSDPPFPMLPSLLQGGKMAKDGSTYKRIPIRKGSGGKNSFDAAQSRQNQLASLREQINADIDAGGHGRFPNVLNAAQHYANAHRSTRPSGQKVYQPKTGPAEFVTASSKQDATTKWIRPAKDADMTGILQNINANLQNTINAAVADITSRWGI